MEEIPLNLDLPLLDIESVGTQKEGSISLEEELKAVGDRFNRALESFN